MLRADYIVVGSGLTGATIARLLTDAGREVVVLERRSHVGGNVHDFVHASGVRIHTHGPHYFRTGSSRIRDFVSRFASFYRYEPSLLTFVDGRYEHWPIVGRYIERAVGSQWVPAFTGTPTNFEEACLAQMPRLIYEKFVKGYTEKQWGVSSCALSAELATRFDVRTGEDTRLSRHAFQGLPAGGYHKWMCSMLDGIPVETDTDYLLCRSAWRHRRRLIFTGPIDEFFDFALGKLTYRAQHRLHVHLPNVARALPCGQVNNPDPENGPYIRLIEWKHMMDDPASTGIVGTVVTSEVPFTAEEPDSYEYPFPDRRNRELFAAYARLAAARPDVVICGRLGEYRYYDMDQAIGRASKIARELLAM